MTKFLCKTLVALLIVGLAPAAFAGPVDLDSYPDYAETEFEQSIITIPLFAHGDKENPVEILKLTAFMRLVRELPVRNGLGHRQVEFTIADWELYGYSEYLDADVTFKLSDVPVQPKSLVISLTEESDYPAMIIYNAIYDIYIGQKRVAANRPGVAFAKNVYEIPPRNISVAFSKPFETGDGSKTLEWDPGTCEDMFQITEGEFLKGVGISKAIRAGKTTLKK